MNARSRRHEALAPLTSPMVAILARLLGRRTRPCHRPGCQRRGPVGPTGEGIWFCSEACFKKTQRPSSHTTWFQRVVGPRPEQVRTPLESTGANARSSETE